MERSRWILLAVAAVLVLSIGLPFVAFGDPVPLGGQAAYPIPQIWAEADGPGTSSHAWIWGPALLAAAHEPSAESPGGSRQVYYFDKGRLEINDPSQDPSSEGYVTSGLLVRDLIAGEIQIGKTSFVASRPASIPIAGDLLNNPSTPTYAALNAIASVGTDLQHRRDISRVGQPVTALMRADGSIDPGAVPNSSVVVGLYGNETGHNIAKPFADWMADQQQPWEFLTGYPLTDPYWIDAVVNGTSRRILFQAFERRVLTYTPGNPDGWTVESNNVGQHYRSWHHLSTPSDQPSSWLATGVPFGEAIVAVAEAHNLDPFVFAAVAQVASNFNPAAVSADGHAGLFGDRPALLDGQSTPLEPYVNAEAAARQLAEVQSWTSDWRAALSIFYTGDAHPDWSNPDLNAFVDGVLKAQAQLITQYNHPPPAPAGPPARVVSQHNTLAAPELRLVDTGPAAYYSPNYSVAWWDWTLARHASWGQAVPGWKPDPNGYYCVHPDFKPGDRLQLTANGVTLWCTIGDSVAAQDEAAWRAKWAVELSWNTFVALGLQQHNWVEVRHP